MLGSHLSPSPSESGFALTELLMAILLISIALVAMMTSLDAAGRLTLVAQRHEQAISIGQQEIERLRAITYAQLDLAAKPSHEGTGLAAGDPHQQYPKNPNFYVQGVPGTHFEIRSDYKNSSSAPPSGFTPHPGGPAGAEPLVDEIAGGAVNPGPQTVQVGSTEVKVWRYVTWRRDPRQTACAPSPCVQKNSKRITVAVRPESSAGVGPLRPIYVSTVVTSPTG